MFNVIKVVSFVIDWTGCLCMYIPSLKNILKHFFRRTVDDSQSETQRPMPNILDFIKIVKTRRTKILLFKK